MKNLSIEWEDRSVKEINFQKAVAVPEDGAILTAEKQKAGKFMAIVIMPDAKQKVIKGIPSFDKAKNEAVRWFSAYHPKHGFPDKIM